MVGGEGKALGDDDDDDLLQHKYQYVYRTVRVHYQYSTVPVRPEAMVGGRSAPRIRGIFRENFLTCSYGYTYLTVPVDPGT